MCLSGVCACADRGLFREPIKARIEDACRGTAECTTISDGGRIFHFTGEAPYKENRESETGIKQQKQEEEERDWGT